MKIVILYVKKYSILVYYIVKAEWRMELFNKIQYNYIRPKQK